MKLLSYQDGIKLKNKKGDLSDGVALFSIYQFIYL